MFSQIPRAMSWKLIAHYAQFLTSDKFDWFDYGRSKNLEYYNSEEPPEYPVENIKVPIYLMTSADDAFATIKVIRHL